MNATMNNNDISFFGGITATGCIRENGTDYPAVVVVCENDLTFTEDVTWDNLLPIEWEKAEAMLISKAWEVLHGKPKSE